MNAEEFGPQGEHVLALIRRAGKLTPEEAAAAGNAWFAARYRIEAHAQWVAIRAAWNAAWDVPDAADRLAAQAAVEAAIWSPAGGVPGTKARGAAQYAATALTMRDLIGRSDFTQAHYDTLTKPWRTTIGPVHPDDAYVKIAAG